MKTNRLFSLFLIAVLCMCTLSAQEIISNYSINSKLSKKELKALKKKKKQQADSIAHAEASEAIKKGVYILIMDKRMSYKINLEDRKLNFIIVENGKMLLQTGTALSYSGNNNLGGITIISEIAGDIEIKEKKNGEIKSKFKLVDDYLSGNVNVKLYKEDNYGEIGILENSTGEYLSYSGYIIPFDPALVGSTIEVGKLFTPEGWNAFSLGKNRDVGVLMDYFRGRI